MSKAKITTHLKKRVKKILHESVESRDSDNILIANIWYAEITKEWGFNYSKMKASQLLIMIAEGKLTPTQSITRARRKVQEENPELRGEKYNKRQKAQENIQGELGYTRWG